MAPRADGQKPRTEEHCFPRWLADMIPGATAPSWDHTVRNAVTGAVTRSWSTRDLSVTSRRVCRDCNTGWMADLENSARPHLSPLLRGEPCVVTEEAAAALAAWAAKTNLALELANPMMERLREGFYRDAVRAAGKPPERTQVFLGAYSGPRDFFHFPKRLHGLPDGAQGYRTTMIVGKALFHVFGHDHIEALDLDLSERRLNATPRMWPGTRTLNWPSDVLDEQQLWQYLA